MHQKHLATMPAGKLAVLPRPLIARFKGWQGRGEEGGRIIPPTTSSWIRYQMWVFAEITHVVR